MRTTRIYPSMLRFLLALAAVCLLISLTLTAKAQDFYGKGNVLIAVDMAPYAENGDVSYPEDSMGILVWGEDAPEGENTREAFQNRHYEVSPDVVPVPAPEYELKTAYSVKQTVFLPFCLHYDPDLVGLAWFTADELPAELFSADGEPKFLIHQDAVEDNNGEKLYRLTCEKTPDGKMNPCVDFLEIECVAVTERITVWQYTGVSFSTRTGFDPDNYGNAVGLTDAEIRYFTDVCENACRIEGDTYGDPRWEDAYGDRDGKVAFVAITDEANTGTSAAYYWQGNTDYFGFDGLIMNPLWLPERALGKSSTGTENTFSHFLIHELNHYIVVGCTGRHEGTGSSAWIDESLAQRAVGSVSPEDITAYQEHSYYLTDRGTRLRMIPGMLWGERAEYPVLNTLPYSMGRIFLEYMEIRTTGKNDGRLWTEYLAHQTPDGGNGHPALEKYILDVTGESLEAWMAQFMAALIVGADDGPLCPGSAAVKENCCPDLNVFLREAGEYGLHLGVIDENSAVDTAIIRELNNLGITAFQGGGTTYAYRNDESCKIAVTGADERWYFFAVTMDLPDPSRIIEISAAEELAKIGKDPAYPLSGHYLLTADLDLKGSPENQWTPIGTKLVPFIGKLDGNGHTIRNLYIDAELSWQGLFGAIAGNADIRNLTVTGSVNGKNCVGSITGETKGGTLTNCVSYAPVTGSDQCGGITGFSEFGTVSGCACLGTVTGSGSYIGGIVGYSLGGTTSGCTKRGTVTGSGSIIGGIVGYSRDSSRVTDCTADGPVTGDGNYCGGIVGVNINQSAVERCCNFGPVTGGRHVGGIVGTNGESSTECCRNLGTVTGTSGVGGIVGGGSFVTVLESWNNGILNGENNVGGIVGTMIGDCLIRDCYHTGTVNSNPESLLGGIAGDGYEGVITVENSYSYERDLPAFGAKYEGTATGCYTRSDTNTGEGFLSTEAFADPAGFPEWDFENVWTLENGIRPELRNNPEI